ncbi:MAG: enoyl-CoA hydratase/isomerase family protein [Dehalococcoidia bacterium]
MIYKRLILEVADSVATVTLNNPEKLNALDATLRQELLDVCHELKHDDSVRAVVWTGAGRGFCSGAQVSGAGPVPAEHPAWQEMLDEDGWVGRQAKAVYQLEKPCIAAVNGVAAGAGMSLALACDIRIGSENARFKTVFIERNLSPDAGMTYFLPRIVGTGNALEMILTSRAVGAEEALRMGLLQRVVTAETLVSEAEEMARTIAGWPPLAAMASKRAVQRSLDNSFEDQLRYELTAIGFARKARQDAEESARAFVEKRKPNFTGR